MKFRNAEEKDIESILNLAFEFEEYLDDLDMTPDSEKVSKETMQRVLLDGFSDPKHAIMVVEEEGQVIGFSDIWVYPEVIHGGNSAYLNNIFISRKYQRKGIGSKLLSETIKKAKDMKAVALHISVLPKNVIAQNFYKKNGITWEIKMYEMHL
jgi:ribosomal protein S18 acetylase RimI-like enzyme